jgi:hypothetical protein
MMADQAEAWLMALPYTDTSRSSMIEMEEKCISAKVWVDGTRKMETSKRHGAESKGKANQLMISLYT